MNLIVKLTREQIEEMRDEFRRSFNADKTDALCDMALRALPDTAGEAVAMPVAFLVVRAHGGVLNKEVVLAPLTDDTYMVEGDEAFPLYAAPAALPDGYVRVPKGPDIILLRKLREVDARGALSSEKWSIPDAKTKAICASCEMRIDVSHVCWYGHFCEECWKIVKMNAKDFYALLAPAQGE